jgi:hypothetical protein
MKTTFGSMLALALFVTATPAQEPKTITVTALPPSVVQTVPRAGDLAVDPALREIRVTFSKDMLTDRMWAVCQISKESFPQMDGEIHYLADRRT